ncbi:MAG: type III-A CRISPR-associated protein Csm2 [Anaerovoracaceae bacterium]
MNIITEANYVDMAENVIEKLSKKKKSNGKSDEMVTTSKIRNLLSMTSDIYNDVISQSDTMMTDEQMSRIEYLRIRVIYESGREKKVKDLVQESKMIEIIKSIGREKKEFLLFNKYMEALVAFHRYYGGNDH